MRCACSIDRIFEFELVDDDLNVDLAGVMPDESVANVTRCRRGIHRRRSSSMTLVLSAVRTVMWVCVCVCV